MENRQLTREEFIDKQLERSGKQEKLAKEIQMEYEQYISGHQEVFVKLIADIDKHCGERLRKRLTSKGQYTKENEEDVLQECHLAVWKMLEKDRADGKVKNNVITYVCKAYQNQTMDLVRENVTAQKKLPTQALYEADSETGEEKELEIPDKKGNDWNLEKDKRLFFGQLLVYYCRGFLHLDQFPPSLLGFYYARVLPHLESDGRKTATAVQWAHKRMGSKRIAELKEESERELQKTISEFRELTEEMFRDIYDDTFCWGEAFVKGLDQFTDTSNEVMLVRDVVYTDEYKKKTKNWAEYVHQLAAQETMKLMKRDTDTLESARAYITSGNLHMYRMLKGERL